MKNKWAPVKDLQINDTVQLIFGNSSQLVSIQFIAEQVKVFNITVEGP